MAIPMTRALLLFHFPEGGPIPELMSKILSFFERKTKAICIVDGFFLLLLISSDMKNLY